MKTGVFILAAMVVLISMGCDRPVCDCPPFPNGDTVSVNFNQKKVVYSCCVDQRSITFSSVRTDSRCPEEVICATIGIATIAIKLNNLPVELQLGIPRTVHDGHIYTLHLIELTPHPKAGLPTDPNSYQAKIVVSRN